jgi:hypothetical protein
LLGLYRLAGCFSDYVASRRGESWRSCGARCCKTSERVIISKGRFRGRIPLVFFLFFPLLLGNILAKDTLDHSPSCAAEIADLSHIWIKLQQTIKFPPG